MRIVLQEYFDGAWRDVDERSDVDEAKEEIKRLVEEGASPNSFRIIDLLVDCKTEVVFIDYADQVEKKTEEDENIVTVDTEKIYQKDMSDDEIKLEYFRKSCEARRFLETKDIHEIKDLPTYNVMYYRLGSMSNIKDMI